MLDYSFLPCQDFDLTVCGQKSPSDGKSSFLPIFRSGCCAEKGPKQYMEDEHICIDNLFEHLGETAGFPSPGAFYGVCNQFKNNPLLDYSYFLMR